MLHFNLLVSQIFVSLLLLTRTSSETLLTRYLAFEYNIKRANYATGSVRRERRAFRLIIIKPRRSRQSGKLNDHPCIDKRLDLFTVAIFLHIYIYTQLHKLPR